MAGRARFVELLPLVPLLTDPAAHGIDGPAFDVVIPSLPGYGFSDRPARTGVNYRVRGRRSGIDLMRGLGYERYGGTGRRLRRRGSHVHGAGRPRTAARHPPDQPEIAPYPGPESRPLSEAERAYLDQNRALGGRRARLQRDPVDQAADARVRPQRLARRAGRVDPREVAVVDRLRRRPRRALRPRLPADHADRLLGHADDHPVACGTTTTTGGTASTSARTTSSAYRPRSPVFDNHFVPEGEPPREWIERLYDVRRWTPMPRGGHFAPAEEPELVARDIAEFFAGVLKAGPNA